VTGLAASVVYWPPEPKFCAGAPTSPEKTWFQTPLVQPSRLLFRTTNCCWVPFSTVLPENCESAMKPPLEKLGDVQ
jgi:hypothetical protein